MFADFDPAVDRQSDPCRIIPSVFQSFQTIYDPFFRVPFAHVSYNTAHKSISSCCFLLTKFFREKYCDLFCDPCDLLHILSLQHHTYQRFCS